MTTPGTPGQSRGASGHKEPQLRFLIPGPGMEGSGERNGQGAGVDRGGLG